MDNNNKTNAQKVDKKNTDDKFDIVSNHSIRNIEDILSEIMDSEIAEIEEESRHVEIPTPSKRHKIRMNRLFRERVGGSFLPFPEADNLYERLRSKLIIKIRNKKAKKKDK
jgi:hypothetical protein